jgi:hypothetical protein
MLDHCQRGISILSLRSDVAARHLRVSLANASGPSPLRASSTGTRHHGWGSALSGIATSGLGPREPHIDAVVDAKWGLYVNASVAPDLLTVTASPMIPNATIVRMATIDRTRLGGASGAATPLPAETREPPGSHATRSKNYPSREGRGASDATSTRGTASADGRPQTSPAPAQHLP